jgi:hypothetical protein
MQRSTPIYPTPPSPNRLCRPPVPGNANVPEWSIVLIGGLSPLPIVSAKGEPASVLHEGLLILSSSPQFTVNPTKIKAALAALGLLAMAALSVFAWKAHEASPGTIRLSEGVEIFYPSGTYVSVTPQPDSHEVRVDGEALVQQSASAAPLTIRTRLLVITATPPSEFRVTARGKSPSEQIEVIAGRVEARKAYASKDSAPQTLAAGEMTLINQDIDLMEKERVDLPGARAWRDALLASVKTRRVIDSH